MLGDDGVLRLGLEGLWAFVHRLLFRAELYMFPSVADPGN